MGRVQGVHGAGKGGDVGRVGGRRQQAGQGARRDKRGHDAGLIGHSRQPAVLLGFQARPHGNRVGPLGRLLRVQGRQGVARARDLLYI